MLFSSLQTNTGKQYYRLLFLISYLVFIMPSAQAANPPLSLDEYWQKVEQTQALVRNLQNIPQERVKTQLETLAAEWENITQVELPDGSTMAVNHSFLVAQLRADPPNLAQSEALLTTLLAARDGWPSSKHAASDLESLEKILAQPQFQWQPEQLSPLSALLQRVLEYFWEWISPLLPEEAVINLNAAWPRYLLTAIGSVLLILVLFFMFKELVADLVADTDLGRDPETGEEVLTAETAFKRAQELSGAKDYRTAVRYLYLSSLLMLDERGLLRYDRSQTNREYLRKVAHLPRLQAILQEVIDVFDRVWYGYQSLDEKTYAQYAARVAELRQQK